ncbi:hypothetical protein RAB80_004150 [Fusarium oxysporum f. sp. vasinfectum]|uniref:Uncharacterized protein n=1 Tax=Fusarium oxysporum f. sp. vasinfectum 25433 TaxID=1089449 RepID=X0KUH9_FUSOX|nr:hypothetical protein FOTG_14494 [Fusarium oxysporum f. sp. vasinfectum 25433]KAK2678969.1 hypothetical protein RAB80_004150 [Fusarium oxysporum f. sp. vasinfectum]KAK2692130.1 hypothetical protein QWA68_009036 [Fusarium oxysporum]KAK2936502.1 hypothetical protein FoTM2_004448 [Fusarium oxysporum f. sp. vasinfectum]
MSSTSNPVASITNNSGSSVDIYDVFNPSTDPKMQGPLTYTKLATVSSGSTQQVQTIHFASQLQAMFTGNVTALSGTYYQQFPVAVLAVSPFADSNAFTVTSDNQQSMVDSFKFIKYTQANPSSQLATQFRTALGDTTNQKNAVNKFFQSTGSFKLCTLTTWTAVFTWQAQFTNPWQGTYYLYSLDKVPTLVATLAITASAENSSAVLTMAGTNNENTAVVMAGDGTMSEQNQGTGNLSVALTPTWLNVAQTSQQDGKTVSNYVIGAAFTGTINGQKVAGNLNQLAIPDPSDNSKNANNKNAANGFSLSTLEGLIGMLTSIGMLYYMAKGHKQAETQKKNDVEKDATSKKDAEDKVEKVDKDYQAESVPEVAAQAEKVEATVPEVQQGYKEVVQAQDVQSKQDTIRQQEKSMEEVLEGGAPSEATENTAMNLAKADKEVSKAADPNTSPAERDAALSDSSTTLTKTSEDIQTALKDQAEELPKEEADKLKDAQEAIDQVQEETQAEKENQEEQEARDEESPENEVEDSTFDPPEGREAPPFEGAI